MTRPYDIEIMPCSFFEQPYFEQKSNIINFNRKRINTLESKIQEDKNSSKCLNNFDNQSSVLNSSLYKNIKLKAKWMGQSRAQDQQIITVNKNVYNHLVQQNRLKGEKILALQSKIKEFENRCDEFPPKIIYSHRAMKSNTIQNTKLKELLDYNNIRDKRKQKKINYQN